MKKLSHPYLIEYAGYKDLETCLDIISKDYTKIAYVHPSIINIVIDKLGLVEKDPIIRSIRYFNNSEKDFSIITKKAYWALKIIIFIGDANERILLKRLEKNPLILKYIKWNTILKEKYKGVIFRIFSTTIKISNIHDNKIAKKIVNCYIYLLKFIKKSEIITVIDYFNLELADPNIRFIKENNHKLLENLLENSNEYYWGIKFLDQTNLKLCELRELRELCIKQNPTMIKYLENPSVKLCTIAVKKLWLSIIFIKNKNNRIKLNAIKSGVLSMQFINKKNIEFMCNVFNKKSNQLYNFLLPKF